MVIMKEEERKKMFDGREDCLYLRRNALREVDPSQLSQTSLSSTHGRYVKLTSQNLDHLLPE